MSDLGNKDIMAKNIKRYMELKNKDRREICADLGFKYSTFSEWINGKKYPRIDKIEIMANYFGINKSDLVERHIFKLEKQNNNFPSIIQNLPENKQQELEEALNAGYMIISDKNEQTLIKKYRTLNERGKETVNVVLDNYVALSQPAVKDEVG